VQVGKYGDDLNLIELIKMNGDDKNHTLQDLKCLGIDICLAKSQKPREIHDGKCSSS
jgi:hypothetical protein